MMLVAVTWADPSPLCNGIVDFKVVKVEPSIALSSVTTPLRLTVCNLFRYPEVKTTVNLAVADCDNVEISEDIVTCSTKVVPTGLRDITVTQSLDSAQSTTYQAGIKFVVPTLHRVTPNSGPADEDWTVVVHASSLHSSLMDFAEFWFGDQRATSVELAPNFAYINAPANPGAIGKTVDVRVYYNSTSTGAILLSTLPNAYVYKAMPVPQPASVSVITPTQLPCEVAEGAERIVTLWGKGLSNPSIKVSLGLINCETVSSDDNMLRCRLTACPKDQELPKQDTLTVTLTKESGETETIATFGFVHQPRLNIARIHPFDSAPVNTHASLSLALENFDHRSASPLVVTLRSPIDDITFTQVPISNTSTLPGIKFTPPPCLGADRDGCVAPATFPISISDIYGNVLAQGISFSYVESRDGPEIIPPPTDVSFFESARVLGKYFASFDLADVAVLTMSPSQDKDSRPITIRADISALKDNAFEMDLGKCHDGVRGPSYAEPCVPGVYTAAIFSRSGSALGTFNVTLGLNQDNAGAVKLKFRDDYTKIDVSTYTTTLISAISKDLHIDERRVAVVLEKGDDDFRPSQSSPKYPTTDAVVYIYSSSKDRSWFSHAKALQAHATTEGSSLRTALPTLMTSEKADEVHRCAAVPGARYAVDCSPSSSNDHLFIYLAIAGGAVIVAIIAIVAVCYRRKKVIQDESIQSDYRSVPDNV